MASTFQFGEDFGTAAGNPAKGTSRQFSVTQCNWKNTGDVDSVYTSYPITAGNNSYSKYQFGVFGGTFNQISDGRFGHTTGIWSTNTATGLQMLLKINSGYVAPSTTTISTPIDVTIPSGLAASYQVVLFGTVGPEQAGASTLAATGYTQYLITQLVTRTGTPAGDITSGQFTFQYSES